MKKHAPPHSRGSGQTDTPTRIFTVRHLLLPLVWLDRLARKTAVLLIALYQAVVSPLFGRQVCRFHPSCSEYGRQAFDRHLFPRALLLTVWRILRCHPWSRGGPDPVP